MCRALGVGVAVVVIACARFATAADDVNRPSALTSILDSGSRVVRLVTRVDSVVLPVVQFPRTVDSAPPFRAQCITYAALSGIDWYMMIAANAIATSVVVHNSPMAGNSRPIR